MPSFARTPPYYENHSPALPHVAVAELMCLDIEQEMGMQLALPVVERTAAPQGMVAYQDQTQTATQNEEVLQAYAKEVPAAVVAVAIVETAVADTHETVVSAVATRVSRLDRVADQMMEAWVVLTQEAEHVDRQFY